MTLISLVKLTKVTSKLVIDNPLNSISEMMGSEMMGSDTSKQSLGQSDG